jgi:hypothetical protein
MNVWVPNTSGIYFSLQTQPEQTQQRERICVCSGGSYPLIEFFGIEETKQKPEFVEVILAGWDATLVKIIEEPIPTRACISIWDEGATTLEIHPKTPSLLSNFQDYRRGCATSFFFIIKIMTSDDQEGYKIMDVITTTTFRTVSHSKLCPVTRRSRGRHRSTRKEKFSESRDRSPIRLRKRFGEKFIESENRESRSFERIGETTLENFGVDDSIGLPLELFQF